ncbi:DUF3772 domain-containing protein [Ancylobacter sp. 6x-1]|uniref:DUF3772 domain-containing protein n=1 Tax=Ancylobacter crimeensis TaxID=2579147 RepID=A0ABT0DDV4_9HYPH|nr:DUF3772 domain-containing protein [Ancylobacter crimeensis]MCK0198054.1 DUF3772 domain-containing protein [Ancylobacter crimeensis]
MPARLTTDARGDAAPATSLPSTAPLSRRPVALFWRRLLPVLAMLVMVLGAGLSAGFAQDADLATFKDKLEGQRAIVDGVEAGLGRESLRPIDLDELRNRLDPAREMLAAGIAQFDPRAADMRKRIDEIGPKPAADAPPEDASITQERDQLNARAAELDGVLKQAKLLKVRADQLSDRITGKRRSLFTDTLFARSYSVLDPQLWIAAAQGIPVEFRGIGYLMSDWAAYAGTRMPVLGQVAVLAGVALIILVTVLLTRMFARPLRRFNRETAEQPVSRLRASLLSVLAAAIYAIPAPVALLAVLALGNAFDLLPPRVSELSASLMLAVVVFSVGRGLMQAALAPDAPRRRVLSASGLMTDASGQPAPTMSDETARLLYRSGIVAVTVLAATAFLGGLHRTLVVPLQLTVATSALMSLLLSIIAARTLNALGGGEDDDDAPSAKPDDAPGGMVAAAMRWVRLPFWILTLGVAIALVTGYVAFAAFLTSRALTAAILAGALYVVIGLINAFFIENLQSGHRTRAVAKTLGVRPASVELLGVLTAGVLKVIALVAVVVIVVGTWGTSTADLRDLVSRVSFGFTIGASTITIGDVAGAVIFLVIGIIVARAIQRWFAAAILPRTGLEPGLQNSIATIIGYVGSITVVAISMGQLGLNLQNIALVAGALSVGIGFGLQSIVSNFVSGLILLAERPIRVGDMIQVKGEEGYVRRISVRATEIETFDRAMVLIPNSDLITGMVKNFTHANTTGRVIVQVNVAYDADVDQVRDLLIDCACDHPQVLRSPPPRVFLMNFADSYLQFELRCVVANVDYALTVKSDLHFSVFDRLKKNRIGIPFTTWSIYRGEPIKGA